jgi:hypothetical protein
MSTIEPSGLLAHHSPEEALKGLGSLSAADKAALMKIARIYARVRQTRYDHEDLFHEAATRRWSTSVAFVAFMAGVMRGIAWDWRGGGPNEELDENEEATGGPTEGDAVAKIDAQKLLRLFDDDPTAQKLIIGMMEGARGEELCESSGLSKNDYESERKKIRRRIERLWLNEDMEKQYGAGAQG